MNQARAPPSWQRHNCCHLPPPCLSVLSKIQDCRASLAITKIDHHILQPGPEVGLGSPNHAANRVPTNSQAKMFGPSELPNAFKYPLPPSVSTRRVQALVGNALMKRLMVVGCQ